MSNTGWDNYKQPSFELHPDLIKRHTPDYSNQPNTVEQLETQRLADEIKSLRIQLAEANARADRAASIADLAMAINYEWKCEPGKSAAHEWRLWSDRKGKMEARLKEMLNPERKEASDGSDC